jgi:hypothetical protein
MDFKHNAVRKLTGGTESQRVHPFSAHDAAKHVVVASIEGRFSRERVVGANAPGSDKELYQFPVAAGP